MIKKQFSKTAPVCTVTFSLTNEQVGKNAEVRVLGTFNDWSWDKGLALGNKKKGYEGSIELAAGAVYEFRYLVNGQSWFNDETADDYKPTPFFSHNCILAIEAVTVDAPAAPKAKAAAAPKAAKTAAPKAAVEEKAPAAPKAKATPKAAVAAKAPKAPKAPKAAAVVADDLKKIEGIGPKIAQLLHADGITTFAELAKAKQPQLKAVLAAAGPRFKLHEATTWPEQAALAAAGKWEELAKLQAELDGGKR